MSLVWKQSMVLHLFYQSTVNNNLIKYVDKILLQSFGKTYKHTKKIEFLCPLAMMRKTI